MGQMYGDLTQPEALGLMPVDTVFCAANPRTFTKALPAVLDAARPTRVVVISSTSVLTKLSSTDAEERRSIVELVEAERSISEMCESRGTTWTILRPTLTY